MGKGDIGIRIMKRIKDDKAVKRKVKGNCKWRNGLEYKQSKKGEMEKG